MLIILPIGGQGLRFKDAGYQIDKVQLPITDRFSFEKKPMVLGAMRDIPEIDNSNNQIICIGRDFHETNGLNDSIRKQYPNTIFLIDNILKDQAYGCYVAKEYLKKHADDELFIGCCDAGMDINTQDFKKKCLEYDVLIISHRGDTNIENNPLAHSWLKLDNNQQVAEIKLKQTVSDNFMQDHATTGMFWFKKSQFFLKAFEEMLQLNDTFNGKFYVEGCINYCIKNNLKVGFYDVDYIGWGTPFDYENYQKTIQYWQEFREYEQNKNKEIFSIIVPVFNEEKNIQTFIGAINQALNDCKTFAAEVIIIDGHSTDNTFRIAQENINNLGNPKIKIYQRDRRYGYGADIMFGLAKSRGNIMCWTHGDMQTSPPDILQGLKIFNENIDKKLIVKGIRKKRNFIDVIFTFGMQIMVLLILRVNIFDINAQPKIFSREFYQKFLLDQSPQDFSLDLFLLYQAKRNGYKILGFPVLFLKRLSGEAKGGGSFKGKIKLIIRTCKFILKLSR